MIILIIYGSCYIVAGSLMLLLKETRSKTKKKAEKASLV